MKKIIRINRKSIRKNPDAGRTIWYIKQPSEVRFTYWGSNIPEWMNEKNVFIEFQELDTFTSQTTIRGIIINPDIIPELYEYIQSKKYNLVIEVKNNIREINTITPAPEYLYKYENTKVRCKECNSMIPVNDIEEDVFEDEIIEICPKCQKWDTFVYEYEKIEDVIN